jgi:hypothetical protein
MAKIIENGDDSVHVNADNTNIWLTIGLDWSDTQDSLGTKRHSLLTAAQARILAYALLSEAERFEQTALSD